MIVLYILLGFIALLLLLLCIPVHADITYYDEIGLTVRYLFLKFQIMPEQEKEEKKAAKTDVKPKKKGQPKEKKPNPFVQKVKRFLKAEGFTGFFELVGRLVNLTGTAAVRIIKKLRIREFDLYLMTGGPDAAEAAILYGKVCAVVYPAAEMLFRLVKCKKHRVSVDLDYSVQEPYVKLEADVLISPIFAVHYALRYLFGVIPVFRRFMNPVDRKRIQAAKSKPQLIKENRN